MVIIVIIVPIDCYWLVKGEVNYMRKNVYPPLRSRIPVNNSLRSLQILSQILSNRFQGSEG